MIIGDINKEEPDITVYVDSLRLIRYVYSENVIYRYFYGENDFTVLAFNEEGDSINCETFSYDLLNESCSNARNIIGVEGTITNSGWHNAVNLLNMGISLRNPRNKSWRTSLLTNYMSMYRIPFVSFVADVLTLLRGNWLDRALTLTKWIDNSFQFYVFRGANITTLPHEEISDYSVRLRCQITGLNRIPRIRNLEAYAVCSMRLRPVSGASGATPDEYMNWDIKERRVNSDGEQNFDYSNLLLEAQYEYYPQLNLAWTEVEASVWVKLTDDVMPDIEDWTVTTEEHRSFQTLRGDNGGFFTSRPIATTGGVDEVKVDEATVRCSFSGVPNDGTCGIECIGGDKMYLIDVDDEKAINGEKHITIDDLKPSTTYNYRAYVDTKYKTYYGRKRSFRTLSPSCTTGECIETTEHTAVVKCSYSNISNACECGVMVSDDSGMHKVLTSNTDGERKINIPDLKAATTYNYWAYIEIDGVPENGEVKSFTTDLPDISGTWTCTEEYYPNSWSTSPKYKSYSLKLYKDGLVGCSEYESIVSGSWSFENDGTVNISINVLATQTANSGVEWSGTVDDISNPTRVTGSKYNWNTNQYGYFKSDSHKIVMTR